MLNVIMLSFIMLSVIMLSDIMLSVIMLSVVMLNVVVPQSKLDCYCTFVYYLSVRSIVRIGRCKVPHLVGFLPHT